MIISTQNYEISVKLLQIEGKTKMKTEVFLSGFRLENYTDYLF
jgi:methionyl-tRNA formyltransferase